MIEHADLWLLRHGYAGAHIQEESDAHDFARPLDQTGVKQSVAAGVVLRKLADVDKVFTSPRVRCVQTAAISTGMGFKRDKHLDHGKPGAVLDHAKDGRTTLVVGHHNLSDAVKKATGKTVDIDKGGLVKLEVRDGQWKVAQMLGPQDVAKLAR